MFKKNSALTYIKLFPDIIVACNINCLNNDSNTCLSSKMLPYNLRSDGKLFKDYSSKESKTMHQNY